MKILNQNGMTELYIYDVIDPDEWDGGISARMVVDALNNASGDLGIRVNSPGGDVFEGLAIYNAFNRYDKGKKIVSIDGAALSISSVLAMAGDEINMAENAMMMIHNTKMYAFGDSIALRASADKLDAAKRQLVDIYAARTGGKAEDISGMMDAETWMTAQQALDQGFCTSVIKNKARMVAKFDPKKFKHVPEWASQLVNSLKEPAAGEPPASPPPAAEAPVPWELEILKLKQQRRMANLESDLLTEPADWR